MKRALLHIIAAATIMIGATADGYWWRFNNFTDKAILIKLTLLASNNPYYAIVLPDMSVIFDWSPPNIMSGFCLNTIQWIIAPNEILTNQKLVNNDYKVLNNSAMHLLFFGKNARYKLNDGLLLFTADSLYNSTTKAIKGIGRGIDYGFCLGNQDNCPFLIKKAIAWAAKTHATSRCAHRNIAIIEDDNSAINFYTVAH